MNNSYHTDLQRQLDSISDALEKTNTLSKILDEEWCKTIRNEIANFKAGGVFYSNSALMFFQLKHPFRGIPWFENAQSLALRGEIEKLTSDEKMALAFCGFDPIKVFLPICDERLTALSKLPFKTEVIGRKFHQLKECRYSSAFRNHLFELLILGFFAKENALIDIDPADTMVDGVLNIDNRRILLEVTFTSQELLSDQPGVHTGDVNALISQVIYKAKKKVADGRQLALAMKIPAILVLELNRLGADDITSRIGIEVCFDDPDFSKLSGVVVSDSWKLMTTRFYRGKNPEIPLSMVELTAFQSWFGKETRSG